MKIKSRQLEQSLVDLFQHIVVQPAAEMRRRIRSSTKLDGLRSISTGLKAIVQEIIEVRQKFDSALSPVRTRLTEVEVWYDTVMQSFNERYTRSMKTWAVVVSVVVVVFLNNNFFNIYQNITSNQDRC